MDSQAADTAQKGTSTSAQHQPPADKKAVAQYDVPVKKKKNKKRYSRNAKPAEQFEKRISKSVHRVSKAVEKGIRTYLDERNRSRDRRKDGPLIESYVNVAEGISEGVSDAAPALPDVAKAINSKRTRKVLRKVIKAFPFPR